MNIRYNSKMKRILAIFTAFTIMISACGINFLVNAADNNVIIWNSGDDIANDSISNNQYFHWTVESDSTVSPYGNSYHLTLPTGKGAFEPQIKAKGVTFDNNVLAEQSALAFWIKVSDNSTFTLRSTLAFNKGNTYSGNIYSGTRTFVNTKTNEITTTDGNMVLTDFEGFVLYDLTEATIGDVNAQQFLKENGFSSICLYMPQKISTEWDWYFDHFCFVKDVNEFIEDVAPEAEVPNHNVEVWNAGEDTADSSIGQQYAHWTVSKDSLVSPHGDSYHVNIQAGKGAFWGNIYAKDISFDKNALAEKEGLAFWIKVPENVSYTLNGAVEFNTSDDRGNDYSGTKTFINTKTGEVTTSSEGGYTLTDFEGYVIYDLKDSVIKNVRKENTKTTDSMSTQDFLKTYGFSRYSVYVPSVGSVDKDWYLDHFCFIKDVDAFVEETVADALVSVAPPTANPQSGYIDKGTKVSLSAEDGCDIYYTVDGTKPTTSSAKFDPQAPIEVNSSMMITAIAVKNGKSSSVAMFSYGVIDPESQNTVVVNDGSDASKLTFYPENAFIKTVEEGISPNGSAYSVNAQIKQTATLLSIGMEKRDANWMAAQDAFSMYIRVPKGITFNYVTCVNSEGWYYKGTIATYNIITGEYEEYPDANAVPLSDFEGYLIFKIDDAGINDVRYNQNSERTPMVDYIKTKGFSNLTFYIGSGNITKYNGYDIIIDHLAFSYDYNMLKAEMLATPLRIAAPNADVVSGTVENGTYIYLTAQEGADIYYTVDGTTPTINSTKYILESLGNDNGYISPISLTENTTLKAIAVKDGISSSISTFKYEIELPYDGPDTVILNDGSGEGKNTVSWNDGTRVSNSLVDDVSPNGSAIKFTPVDNNKISSHLITFNLATEDKVMLHKVQAVSYYVKVPDFGEGKYLSLNLRINGESTGYAGKIYALSKDGEVQIFGDGSGTIKLNNFEGTIICTTNGQNDVTTGWGSAKLDWKTYIKNTGLKTLGFIINLPAGDKNTEKAFVFDTFSAHYDVAKLFEELDLEGLLAEYDVGTVENANMIVTNDCSNAKLNGALSKISENITAEFSNHSPDDRSLKLTFGEKTSEISFFSYTKEAEATIADGLTFWVEVPKGTGNVDIGINIAEENEKFVFSDSKFYFLIDKDGYISRHEGKLTIPDGFRGWIILPNDNVLFDETSQFQNGTLEYNNISNITVVFKNENNKLKNKFVYIDDISFYVDFQRLVLSRAIAWKK